MAQKLLHPEGVRSWLGRRYGNQHRSWFDGGGEWPLVVSLGSPTERAVVDDLGAVRGWVDAWARWRGTGALRTAERKWTRIGTQTLPSSLSLADPKEVAVWCGEDHRWARACKRAEMLRSRWTQFTDLGRFFDPLADYRDDDFERLLAVLSWTLENPASGLFMRQLPIVGVDTKWLEGRTAIVMEMLVQLLQADGADSDIYAMMGLRKPPYRIRIRILCPQLRACVGGLCDIEAPLEELVALNISPEIVFVVENRQTGLALPDMQGVVAFLGLGKAVSSLAKLPWVHGPSTYYWGDIDTHGLDILSTARETFPTLTSTMMDVPTLLEFKELAVDEPVQATGLAFANLTLDEQALFDGLLNGKWGLRLRLEQERLPWHYVLRSLADISEVQVNDL